MKQRLRRIIAVLLVLGVVAVVLRFTVFDTAGPGGSLAVSGTVEATESHLGFQGAGRIESVAVREGDATTTGQELAALDRAEALALRDQTEAQIAAARATLRALERGSRPEEVAQAKSSRDAAAVRLQDATRDLERTERLQAGGAVSLEALDKARASRDLASSVLEQAEDQVRLIEQGPRQERVDAQRAQLQATEASLRAADAMLDNMTIVAPQDGVVTARHHEPGEVVGPGATVLTVMDRTDRWVRIFVAETQIGAVSLGQRASIRSDTYPDRAYEGEVTFIASQAEFTPKNVQTAEERVKLVYAVRVRVTGDPGFELKPGMPADVELDFEGS